MVIRSSLFQCRNYGSYSIWCTWRLIHQLLGSVSVYSTIS
jgi:hypothetical protein